MKELLIFILGFAAGVMYMNGTLDEFTGVARDGVNAVAEKVVEATEPTTAEILEETYKQLEQEVVDAVKE